MSGFGQLGSRTHRIVYGGPTAAETAEELRLTTTVDLAHIVMLVDQDLLQPEFAASLVCHIRGLREQNFAPLQDIPMPRGLYMAYENHLIAELGDQIGGRLHTGRSRNDLRATTTAIRLRQQLLDLACELARLQAILLSRARAYRRTIMPVYTHFQAALPITYGYYLAGIALALSRDIDGVRAAVDQLCRSPLGAGAVAGTSLPLDPTRTAALLGFDGPPVHAIDAVASRDTPLRALAAAAGAAITLSRLGTDLQLWSTAEFGFLWLPDRLVGGSSAMPQKRNAFLLEHLKAKAGAATGGWTAAAGMVKSTPFTNCIEVGTEAMAAVRPGLTAAADAVLLSQVLVSGARPVPERMTQRAENSFVTATELANVLVRKGIPFRAAHGSVGDAVRQAITDGTTTVPGFPELSLPEVVEAQTVGGGPGAFDDAFAAAYGALRQHASWCQLLRDRLRTADLALDQAIRRLLDGDRSSP